MQGQSCGQAFYESTQKKSNRAAGFGYGLKYDFTKNVPQGPQPTVYNIQGLFETNRLKQKGSSFGVGRDFMKQHSYIPHAKAKNPGPGQYGIKGSGRERSYSMRPKTVDPWVPSIVLLVY